VPRYSDEATGRLRMEKGNLFTRDSNSP